MLINISKTLKYKKLISNYHVLTYRTFHTCYAISPMCRNADDIQQESFKNEKRFGGGKDRQLKTLCGHCNTNDCFCIKKQQFNSRMWPSVLHLINCKDISFSLLKAGSILLWGEWTSAFMMCFFPLKTALAWGKSLLLHWRSDSQLQAALHTRPLYFLHASCSLYYPIPTLLAWEMKKITSSPAKWSAIHLHNLNHAGLEFHLITSQFTQAHWAPAQTLCCWNDTATAAPRLQKDITAQGHHRHHHSLSDHNLRLYSTSGTTSEHEGKRDKL